MMKAIGLLVASLMATQASAFEVVWNRTELSFSQQEFSEVPGFEDRTMRLLSFSQFRTGQLFLGYGAANVRNLETSISDRTFGVDIGYEVNDRLYLSATAARFLDTDVNQGQLKVEYSITPSTTLGAHYRADGDSDWSRFDFAVLHDFQNGTAGAKIRQYGLPDTKRGDIEFAGEFEFARFDVSFAALVGTSDNDVREAATAIDYAVSDQFGVIGGLGVWNDDPRSAVYASIGGRFAVTEAVSIEGIVGRERFSRNGQRDLNGTTIGLSLKFETGAPRSKQDQFDETFDYTWSRVRAFD